ncbi:MAG: site-specific integrase [Saccharofermentans sp.]|nr:site-specific integrase [Saccharofermentans sp.]
MTINELLYDFIEIYGKSIWTYSTYSLNLRHYRTYIKPYIGEEQIEKVTTKFIEEFYVKLLDVPSPSQLRENCSPNTIKLIHKLLNSAFKRALIWKLIKENPVENAIRPKEQLKPRDIWTIDVLKEANELCMDPNLKLAMNIAFSSTLRLGEILALEWDRVYLNTNRPYLYIDRILQRVEMEAYYELNGRDVYKIFSQKTKNSKSILVMKKPKTESSVRKVYIPNTLVGMLREHYEILGNYKKSNVNFEDNNLVFCSRTGTPIEPRRISKLFQMFIQENNLPKVCFHSLRHTSVTYKLKLTNGNLKAVQGDSGHATIKMITDVYSRIIDEDRMNNADLIEESFYNNNKNAKINLKENSNESLANLEKLLATESGKRLLEAINGVLEDVK